MLKIEEKPYISKIFKFHFCNLCSYLQFFLITQLRLSTDLLLLILPDPTLDLLMYLITAYMQIT